MNREEPIFRCEAGFMIQEILDSDKVQNL